VELYLHSPNMPSWRGAQFKKRRDNFYLLTTLLTRLDKGNRCMDKQNDYMADTLIRFDSHIYTSQPPVNVY
jgi:hypothetical protein